MAEVHGLKPLDLALALGWSVEMFKQVTGVSAVLEEPVNDIDVAHDDWCALLKSDLPCNCDPDIKLRPQASLPPAQPPALTATFSVSAALKTLAEQIARRLNATPATDPPARALFDAGVIYLGDTEIAIEFTDVGYFFVKDGGGQVVVEGVVAKGLERAEKRHRHRKLQKWGKKIFGDDMVIHDPMGHAGGPKSPTS